MNTFPAGRWAADWIWADADPSGASREVVALRQLIELDQVPAAVPCRIASVARHAVWVNGVEVARGPVRTTPHRQSYDLVDISAHLRPGTNVIAALTWRWPLPKPWWAPPAPMANELHRGAFALEASVGSEPLGTDATWQAHAPDGWGETVIDRISGRGEELIDLRGLPADWLTRPAALADWKPALARQIITTGEPGPAGPPSFPGGPVIARPIPFPVPVDVATDHTGDSAILDRIEFGTLVLDAEGPAGTTVTVRSAEFLDEQGRPAPTEHDAAFVVTLDGDRRQTESLDMYGLRGALVEADPGVHVHGITVRTRTHPFARDASFECSDPDLEAIWRIGRRTVTLCSTDAYVDCPTREQRAWTGDAVVHQMVDFTTNTDWSLARWYPQLAASPRPDGMLPMAIAGDVEFADFTVIPDWSLHWVHAVWNLHRYVGDRTEIAALMGVAEGVLRWFLPYCDESGLPTDVPGWVLIDWSAVHPSGAGASLCGLWGRGLMEFAEMAEWLGDSGRAEWARGVHARLREGFERLWDPQRERYADSMVGGNLLAVASQHGQAAALVGGLAPASRWNRLVDLLQDRSRHVDAAFSAPDGPTVDGTPVGGDYLRIGHPEPWWNADKIVRAQPFFRYVVHDALAVAGRADLIAGACLDWTALMSRCDSSWSETWYGGTISHGWSSTPTRDLMTRVLGVEPAEPGFAAARIDPALGDLTWVRGRIPCPAGMIEVDVTEDSLTIDSPIPFVHDGHRYPASRVEIATGTR